MTVQIRGDADPVTDAFARQLEAYAAGHPSAEVEVYRQNPVSVGWSRMRRSGYSTPAARAGRSTSQPWSGSRWRPACAAASYWACSGTRST